MHIDRHRHMHKDKYIWLHTLRDLAGSSWVKLSQSDNFFFLSHNKCTNNCTLSLAVSFSDLSVIQRKQTNIYGLILISHPPLTHHPFSTTCANIRQSLFVYVIILCFILWVYFSVAMISKKIFDVILPHNQHAPLGDNVGQVNSPLLCSRPENQTTEYYKLKHKPFVERFIDVKASHQPPKSKTLTMSANIFPHIYLILLKKD